MSDGNSTDGSDRGTLTPMSRRRLLAALGATGAAGLAGCGGGGSSTDTQPGNATPTEGMPGLGTGTATATPGEGSGTATGGTGTDTSTPQQDLAHVSGQTLRLSTPLNPEEVTFLATWGSPVSQYDQAGGAENMGGIWNAMNERVIHGRFKNSAYWQFPGEVFYGIYESVDFQDDGIRIKIRDDAKWSDGEDITAKAPAGSVAWWALINATGEPGSYPRDMAAVNPWHAVTGLEFPDGQDGKVLKIQDTAGKQDKFPRGRLLDDPISARWTVRGPAHVEPYASLYDGAIENYRRAKNGEEYLTFTELRSKHVLQVEPGSDEDPSAEWAEKWRDPNSVVTSGPWTLSEIRGAQEIVLEPNEHWRNADQVNYDNVVFSFNENAQRGRAALFSDRLDSWSETLPAGAEQNLPSNISKARSPGSDGMGIGLDHSDPHLGKREVRAAIMYALDKNAIGGNVHPEANVGVSIPGGDLWATDVVYTEDWINNNLIDYSQDMERANELMRNAGYSKQGGQWVSSEGEPLEYQFSTTSDSPVFEQTVTSQLSNFGIESEVNTVSDEDWRDHKWLNNEAKMWPALAGVNMTGLYNEVGLAWRTYSVHEDWVTTWNIWGEEEQSEAMEGYSEAGWAADYSVLDALTIDIPPVGDPDGSLEPFSPGYTYRNAAAGPADMTTEKWKKFAWVANWFLPSLPVFNSYSLTYYDGGDSGHWVWPEDHYMWDYLQVSTTPTQLISLNMIQANPENPEDGATVE